MNIIILIITIEGIRAKKKERGNYVSLQWQRWSHFYILVKNLTSVFMF